MAEIEIHTSGMGKVQGFVGRVGDAEIFAAPTTLLIATGEDSGADELTNIGLTYREIDKILKSDSESDPSICGQRQVKHNLTSKNSGSTKCLR